MRLPLAAALILVSASCPPTAGATSDAAYAEAIALEAVAKDPSHAAALPLGGEGPHAENRDAYDTAFAAVRNALQAHSNNAVIRIRYAELLLWREALHPGESGGLRRALDQSVIALRDDPAGSAAAEFLGRQAVLDRLLAEQAAEQIQSVEDALKRAREKNPGNLAVSRTLVRLQILSGRQADAVDSARTFAARSPNLADAFTLQGAAELANADFDAALASFQAALGRSPEPRIEAAAALGAAEALRRLNRLEEAAAALIRARARLDSSTQRFVARESGLPPPELIAWNLGKAFAAAGQSTQAAGFLGPEEMQWISSAAAGTRNQEGVRFYNAKDLENAQRAFREAAQLLPAEPVYWRNAGHVAFARERYADAAWDFRKAQDIEPLSSVDAWKLAVSQAVLGDYLAAYTSAEYARSKAPDQQWLAQWTVVIAYGARGWDVAYSQWSRTVEHDRSLGDIAQKNAALGIVRGGLKDFAERAERIDARYAALAHESLRYRAEATSFVSYFVNHHAEQAPIMQRISDLYRKLPLKLGVPADAVVAARKAQDAVSAHNMQSASRLYAQAIDAAPWWPDAHFALAVASLMQGDETAQQEMATYFSLVPSDGPEARAARKFIERWNQVGRGTP